LETEATSKFRNKEFKTLKKSLLNFFFFFVGKTDPIGN
jgi:hypothetical protein